MAVVQENKGNACPVLDFYELNKYIDTHTTNADICVQKLRKWWQRESNISILDLWKAYLQVHVHKSLWPLQMVIFKGHRYCLTRMDFGLNMVPAIMKSIMDAALSFKKQCQHKLVTNMLMKV